MTTDLQVRNRHVHDRRLVLDAEAERHVGTGALGFAEIEWRPAVKPSAR